MKESTFATIYATGLYRLTRDAFCNAGERILEIRREGLAPESKKSFQDIRTKGDIEAESLLTAFIKQNFPSDGIQGEEGTSESLTADYLWYLDPIDGTTVYAAGMDYFGVSGGRAQSGRGHFGIVRFPALGYTVFGGKSGGGWIDDGTTVRRLREKPSPKSLRESTIVLDLSIDEEKKFREPFQRACMMILKFGSCVFECSLVARGLVGGYLNKTAKRHDAAAISVIGEAEGCIVNDLDGKPIDLRNENVPFAMAGNQAIMDDMLLLYHQLAKQ